MTIQLIETTSKIAPVIGNDLVQNCLIVVPCYNEEKRLNRQAFIQFVDENPDVSFLFVDDGSTDQTAPMITALSDARPKNLFAMSLSQNGGKAEAVRQGLLHASTMRAELVGYWDADLATPLDAIPDFMRVAAKYRNISVIFGSRRPLLGHRIQRTFFRRSVSRICSLLAYQALRLPISDTQCGAKMFRNSNDLRDSLKHPFTAGWLFDVELFARLTQRLQAAQTSFYEYPLAEWDEVEGSKVSSKAILRAGVSMLRLIAEMRLGVKRKSRGKAAVPMASIISRTNQAHTSLAA